MEIEHLSKHQIILVCLLVSFVSSIATGIVTVSLFDQAPPAVTQTINRVVQTTVEKVTPSPTGGVSTKTIVVSEDDAVISSIEKASKGIVRIIAVTPDSVRHFLGFGIITSSSGHIIARVDHDYNFSYKAILSGGLEVALTFISSDDQNKLLLFKAENGQGVDARTFAPVSLAEPNNIKLGQTLVSIGGESENSVATGIISRVVRSADSLRVDRIRTDIYNYIYQTNAVAINLSGEIVGLKIGTEETDGYVTSFAIKNLIPKN